MEEKNESIISDLVLEVANEDKDKNNDNDNNNDNNVDYNFKDKKTNRLCDDKKIRKKREKEKKGKVSNNNYKKYIEDKPKTKKKWSKKKILRIVLISIVSIIAIIGILFGTYVYKADGNIANAALNMAADVLGEEDPIFVLILGVSEDISAQLTDTIILAGYNPDSQKAFMLSIPRDTFIGKSEASAGGYDKINALYQKGPEKTVEAVKKLTGINIDYYVVVKNNALPAIVSAIGEVEFDVPIDMDYDDKTQDLHIHLKAGKQMIDGDKAEQLLRFRHNNNGTSYPSSYGDNDYGRMRTQREFIKAVISQAINGSSSSNLKNVATAVFNNIETNITLGKALGYAPHALKLDVDTIRMEQLPGASDKLNNLWFYKYNSSETYDLVNELLEELALDEKDFSKFYTLTKKQNTSSKSSKKDTNTVANKEENKKTVENQTTNSKTNENTNTVKEAHKHNYTSEVIEKATCKTKGKIRYTCTCGSTKEETIECTPHSLKTTETVSGNIKTITTTCSKCDYKTTTTEKIQSEDKPSGGNTSSGNDSQEPGNTTPTNPVNPPDPTPEPEPTPEPNPTPSEPQTPEGEQTSETNSES